MTSSDSSAATPVAEPATTRPPGAERRVAERRNLRVAATILLAETQTFAVRTLDISSGGLAIVAAANPRPGVQFLIRFPLAQKNGPHALFEARVRVVHSVFSSAEGGFKLGLSFVELPPASAILLIQALG